MKLAIVFPGQGSQTLGMLADLAAEFNSIVTTFAEASTIVGYDLWDLAQHGGAKFEQTEYVQPLLLTADIAVWRLWREQGGATPSFLAGHSLGEYAALVGAEALDFADALRLVAKRGRLMQSAVPQGSGAMLAIVGLDNAKVGEICKVAAQGEVLAIANYNSIGQIVIAGTATACVRAQQLAETSGAKIAKLLAVSVPSHCELMKPAAQRFQEDLAEIKINSPKIPVIQNADVGIFDDEDKIREALVLQLYSPVRWVETILFMVKQGVSCVLECGPGKILTGLNKRISQNLTAEFLGTAGKFKEIIN